MPESLLSNNIDLSIVIPLYNEEESLPELVSWITRIVTENNISTEILLIDDGSRDKSWLVIKQLTTENNLVKGIKFTRNYGKSAALHTGFKHTNGKVVITMDADLQDSPDEIPVLYKLIHDDGFDLVSGWKQKRFDPISKTLPSKFFNAVTSYMSGIKLHDFNCGLKAYRSEVVKAIEIYGEMHRYIPVIAKWAGFEKITEQVVQHRARKYGVTKFGLERFIFGFLDLLSIMFVSRFKKRPMHFFGSLGTISFVIGFSIAIFLILQKVVYSFMHQKVRDVVAQPLFFLALVAVVVGVQLFLAGFLAEMITQSNTKRNEYNLAETIGLE